MSHEAGTDGPGFLLLGTCSCFTFYIISVRGINKQVFKKPKCLSKWKIKLGWSTKLSISTNSQRHIWKELTEMFDL